MLVRNIVQCASWIPRGSCPYGGCMLIVGRPCSKGRSSKPPRAPLDCLLGRSSWSSWVPDQWPMSKSIKEVIQFGQITTSVKFRGVNWRNRILVPCSLTDISCRCTVPWWTCHWEGGGHHKVHSWSPWNTQVDFLDLLFSKGTSTPSPPPVSFLEASATEYSCATWSQEL